jgi:hypothetical protein
MSLQSVGNSLSPQQILHLLHLQSLASAGLAAAVPRGGRAGQILPVDPAPAEDSAGHGSGRTAPQHAPTLKITAEE